VYPSGSPWRRPRIPRRSRRPPPIRFARIAAVPQEPAQSHSAVTPPDDGPQPGHAARGVPGGNEAIAATMRSIGRFSCWR
jgi:hypothetical protein